ncbi:MAG: sigma-70 family RNA polymerase sigma factor [Anaerolineae bacterium]|nr:sigma-70 family RNA polymerase sigma factor [Anaerolineae bacterium]
MDETLLIARAQQGDHRAFAQLVEKYQTPVYNLAYRMLGNLNDAEDAAQETFVRAYTRLNTFRREHKFVTWLLSICAHHCIDRTRRHKWLWLSLEEEGFAESLMSDSLEPDAQVLRAERAREVAEALQHLAPPYRLVIVLKYWYDQSVEEIAQTTGDSVSAVKVKLHRARQMLARALTADCRPPTAELAAVSGRSSVVGEGVRL